MTQDEIIRMARKAGYQSVYLSDAPIGRSYQFLERFAALVAAHVTEECAVLCEDTGMNGAWNGEDCAAAIRARGSNAS